MKRKSVLKLSFSLTMAAVLLAGGWLASAGESKVRADSTPLPGKAGKYNVFILGDLKGYHSDSEGRMAAGGNITLTQGGYSVGGSLSDAERAEADSLVAGGDLAYDSGEVNGNAVYGGVYSGSGKPKGGTGVLRHEAGVIDFAAEFVLLRAKSQELSALPVNGVSDGSYGNFHLTGTDPVLNVFQVSGSALSSGNELWVTAPAGSTAIVNIDGASVTVRNGNKVIGVSRNKVLYNFTEATSLKLENIGIEGTVLAPNAAITFNNGQINGSMIGASFEGSGEFHHQPYTGHDGGTPATPTPSPTPESTATPSPSPTPESTATPSPSPTPESTATPSPSPTPESTPTPTPSPTPESTPTPTSVATPTPTAGTNPTPTPTPTAAPESTPTPTPTAVPESTPTPTSVATPTPTAGTNPTPTPTPTAEETPAPTAEETPAPTAEETPAPTAEETPAPTAEETPAPTATETPAPTAGETPAPSATATASPTTSPATTEQPASTPRVQIIRVPAATSPTVIGTIVTGSDITVDDNPVPLGPVASSAAEEPAAAEQPTPAPSPTAGPAPDDEIILDDEIPLGGVTDPAAETLPQTGESSPAPYYITGLTLAALGVLLSRTRSGRHKR